MNPSFIKISNMLQDKGISNYNFMNTISNPILKSLDPFLMDENNGFFLGTQTEKDIIFKEIMSNVWYFLGEIIQVPSKLRGSKQLQLDMASCAMTYLFTKGIKVWVSVPFNSMTFITSICLQIYMMLLTNPNALLIDEKEEPDENTIEHTTYTIIRRLPPWLIYYAVENNQNKIHKPISVVHNIEFFSTDEFFNTIENILEKDCRTICCSPYSTSAPNIIKSYVNNLKIFTEDMYDKTDFDIMSLIRNEFIHVVYSGKELFTDIQLQNLYEGYKILCKEQSLTFSTIYETEVLMTRR